MATFSRPFPAEIDDLIIDQLQGDPELLCKCALVSSKWLARSRHVLLHNYELLFGCYMHYTPNYNERLIRAFSFVESTLAPLVASIYVAGNNHEILDGEYTEEEVEASVAGAGYEYDEINRVMEEVLPKIPRGSNLGLSLRCVTWNRLSSRNRAMLMSLSNINTFTLKEVTLGSFPQLISLLLNYRNLERLDVQSVLYPRPNGSQHTIVPAVESPFPHLRSVALHIEDRTYCLATISPLWFIFPLQLRALRISTDNHFAAAANLIRAAGPSLTDLTLSTSFRRTGLLTPISLSENVNISKIIIRRCVEPLEIPWLSALLRTLRCVPSATIYIVLFIEEEREKEVEAWATVRLSTLEDSILERGAFLHVRLWYPARPGCPGIVRWLFRGLVEHGRLVLDAEIAQIDVDETWWGET
ncbi:hypothetical protein DXG01_011425 [Tephrocybe rancida]|nr:hypothetical protein DXG01_011425 [Tephrocybe rancida]